MSAHLLYIGISSATEEMKEAIVRAAAEKGYNFPSGRDDGRIPSYANYIYLRPHNKIIRTLRAHGVDVRNVVTEHDPKMYDRSFIEEQVCPC